MVRPRVSTFKRNDKLYFGNSGTLARLLIGILSTTPGIETYVSGDGLSIKKHEKFDKLNGEIWSIFLPKNKFNFPLKLISSSFQ